jgi:hypothetical protein
MSMQTKTLTRNNMTTEPGNSKHSSIEALLRQTNKIKMKSQNARGDKVVGP